MEDNINATSNGDTNNIKQRNDLFNISFKDVCKIGLFQSLSLMSGVSRSATTISAGMLSNFSRIKAVEMAFFISIPASPLCQYVPLEGKGEK